MPDKFKDAINLPIAIPAWGLVTLILGGCFTAGVTLQKLDQVIETSKKIDVIQEKQIGALATVQNHTYQISNHESRILDLERGRKP